MLLAPPPPADLPAEALLARLRARRATFDLQGLGTGGPSPEVLLAWLHPRLDRRLREAIRPCLEVEAMRLLLLALRHRLGEGVVPAELLRQPWLSPAMAPLLETPGDAGTVIAAVEAWLAADYPFAANLTKGYHDQGPGGSEQQLATGILAHALAAAQVPVVRMTLRFRIDVRNLLAVLRHWRWRLRAAPVLVPGGELAPAALTRAWAGGDTAAVGRLADRLAGGPLTEREPRAAERQLLGGLTLRLRRAGRDPLGIGVVLDTLWRCEVAARNRALRQGAGEDDGLLAAALL